MKNQLSSVRFDHREVAVIFSLFVFVSLLMFTVGILVGKGLQQAKYEGVHGPARTLAHGEKPQGDSHGHDAHTPDAGTSITTGHDDGHAPPKSPVEDDHVDNKHGGHDAHANAKDSHGAKPDAHDSHVAKADTHGDKAMDHASVAKEDHGHGAHGLDADAAHKPAANDHASLGVEEPESSLELVPAHPKKDRMAGLDEWPTSKESERVLKDPRMAKYLEGAPPSRDTASIPATPSALPKSFPHGKFTVQVASYPNQREALDRVEALKKLGFPFAYFSAKELENRRLTYRVWLGYFPDKASANQGGEWLISKNEVMNFVVRKSENEG